MSRKSIDLNPKVVGTYLLLVATIIFGFVFSGRPGQIGSIGMSALRFGLLITVLLPYTESYCKKQMAGHSQLLKQT